MTPPNEGEEHDERSLFFAAILENVAMKAEA
jgi:hypothetical protein